jgi:hypothetical protein
MRPLSALAAAVATLIAAAPASAATWTAPTTISAPHTFVSPLSAAATGNGSVVLDWAFQDGVGNTATNGVRGASLAPGATAFGPERTLPRDTSQVVPYASRSIAALIDTTVAVDRRRLSVAFGTPDGPSLGTPRTVATDDVAFVPRLAVGSNGAGILAWIARASGSRRVVKVSLRAPGGRFGASSIISGTGRANSIVAAVGARGERVVAFERGGRLLSRFRAPGRNWGPVEDLGAVAAGTENELAALVVGGGRTTIVDVHRQLSEGGDTGPLLVDAWVRPAGASRFRTAQRLESGAQVAASPPVLVPLEARGAALAWRGADPASPGTPAGPGRRVNVSIMGTDARFGTPQAVSAPGDATTALGGASNGSGAILSWVRLAPGSDTSGQVFASVRVGTGGFGPAEPVSPAENASLTAPGIAPAGPPGGTPFVAWASRPGGEGPGVPLAQIKTFVRVSERGP